jgi:hypothetical protein
MSADNKDSQTSVEEAAGGRLMFWQGVGSGEACLLISSSDGASTETRFQPTGYGWINQGVNSSVCLLLYSCI